MTCASVMVVEQDAAQAAQLCAMLRHHDCDVIGPYGDIEDAFTTTWHARPFAAILNVAPQNRHSHFACAEALVAMEVAVVFTTDRVSDILPLPRRLEGTAVLRTPACQGDLMYRLKTAMRDRFAADALA